MPLARLSARRRAGVYTAPGAQTAWIQIIAPGGRNKDGSAQPGSPFYVGWAAITKLAGDELTKAQQIVQQVTHEVVMTYPTPIGEAGAARVPQNGQVVFDGRTFQIEDVADPDERHVELHLLCVERSQNV